MIEEKMNLAKGVIQQVFIDKMLQIVATYMTIVKKHLVEVSDQEDEWLGLQEYYSEVMSMKEYKKEICNAVGSDVTELDFSKEGEKELEEYIESFELWYSGILEEKIRNIEIVKIPDSVDSKWKQ